eukprot:TRINITY_DN530_c0_g1_i1.p1 TRINITY_DN530_c0_g1~~TRINITY_DN530_c0_g1_i1.p1  ORF type:complete len:463 (-),score=81.23 TRINITY_DN530_c0_g1_i1:42-1430(-)
MSGPDSRYDYSAEPMLDTFALALTIVNWVICSCLQYPMIFSFINHQHLPFFKQRGFWTTFIFVFATIAGQFSSISAFVFNGPCTAWMGIDFGSAWMFTTSAERGFLLYVHYNLGVKAKEYAEESSSSERSAAKTRSVAWLLKHRSWFHHNLFSVTKLASLCAAFLLASPGWYQVLNSPYRHAAFWSLECRYLSVEQLRIEGIALVCISLGCVFGMLCLRGVEDNYFIKLELKIKTVSFIFFSFFVFILLIPSVYNNLGRPILIVGTLEPFYGVATIAFTAMGLVVIMYHRREKQSNKNQRGDSFSPVIAVPTLTTLELGSQRASPEKISYHVILNMILGNEEALRMLENFLMKELSVENLLFVKAVRNLTESEGTDELKLKMGREIFEKFIISAAPLEVNLSSLDRTSLEAIFCSDQVDLTQMMEAFKTCNHEIVNLMALDSLRRFLRTSEFKSLGARSFLS